jgi:hypothetical protein
MRALLALLAFTLAAAAFAQSTARPRPPGLTTLEDPPPPPPMIEVDPALQPKTTTRKEGENTITEYRVGGKLYAMKVTTPVGSYYLVDDIGAGEFMRKEGLSDPIRVPQWTLFTW